MKLIHRAAFILGLVCLSSCEPEKKKQELPFKTKAEYEQTMILSHQEFIKREKEKIENFIDSSTFQFKKTGTGLRYSIYQETQGVTIKKGEVAVIRYTLKSIEGELLYQSPEGGLQEFVVDYDTVESGLHEGVKKMKVGEKAILILPAHLAHGITGDQAAIPSQTTLVYDLHLVGKK